MGHLAMTENRFDRIYRAIARRESMVPPPHFEILVGKGVRSAFLGRPIQTLQDDVDFWSQAGFCLYPLSLGMVLLGGVAPTATGRSVGHAHYSLYDQEEVEMAWASTDRGAITSEEEFLRFPWTDPERMDLAVLDDLQPRLSHGMKVLVSIGKIFTGTWQLMGFNCFCEALGEQPELVARVFERVAAIQTRITERVLAHSAVGAILHADDLAYFSGPMINPAVLRRHVFPAYRKMGEMCRQRNVLYLYHSDGQIKDLIGDIVACGFVGLHPLEPKPMDGATVKRAWGEKICLLGHVDVDLLARGTPEQVRDQTLRNLDLLARGGGYCAGSANSVPDYVPLRNFLAMSEAIRGWTG